MKHYTILLIEDDEVDQAIFKELLPTSTIITVTTIKKGEEILQQGGIDIIFMDINLPDSLGLSGLDRLRSLFPNIAVIIYSGIWDEDIMQEANKKGAQDYLVKGIFDEHRLLHAIPWAIERNNNEQRLNHLLEEP